MAQRVAVPYLGVAGLSSSSVPQEEMEGPVGIQTLTQAVGAVQCFAPSSSKQAELMERLKQLRAWQEQQQAELLRRQQEQLLKLRSEQLAASPRMALGEQNGRTSTRVSKQRNDADYEKSDREYGRPLCS